MDTQIRGIHHVTAMTSSATKIYRFFTDILGMRLIKKQLTKMTSKLTIFTLQTILVRQEQI
ncbi:hypothetical protein G8B33_11040 [Enterococcus faecium]|nr:hypothetical protein [Enterococcus faecium]RBS63309.1 hypothetical protein EB40_01175 [Enterococcus faecium]RBS74339.1 hypothetical protein EB47_01279 [Enterococcus faecium]RBT12344.1 hypothetical protein EA91_01354 [Enterococcus faecium]